MTPVKYPEMRLNLRAAATDLADQTFHAEVWAHPRKPVPDMRFQFHEAMAYVVDDLDAPRSLVGDVLADEFELATFEDLSNALHVLLDRIGSRGPMQRPTPPQSGSECNRLRANSRRR
jgi:hypothetical protein